MSHVSELLGEIRRLKRLVASAEERGEFCSCGTFFTDTDCEREGWHGTYDCDVCPEKMCSHCFFFDCENGEDGCVVPEEYTMVCRRCAWTLLRRHNEFDLETICRPCATREGLRWADLQPTPGGLPPAKTLFHATAARAALRRAATLFFAARDLSGEGGGNRRRHRSAFMTKASGAETGEGAERGTAAPGL